MGTTLSRHPLVRPAPTQLLLAADSTQPVIAESHAQYATASYQETATTGC